MRWELTLYWCSSMKKGIHCRTWGNVAMSCKMWESEPFLSSFPDLTKVAHVGLFTNVAINCKTSSSHFLCILFILGGKHQLPPFDFSPILSFLVHLIKPCPFPPQITSSGPSRQHFSRQQAGGNQRGRSRDANALSMAGVHYESRGLSVSTFCSVFALVDVILISDQCNY